MVVLFAGIFYTLLITSLAWRLVFALNRLIVAQRTGKAYSLSFMGTFPDQKCRTCMFRNHLWHTPTMCRNKSANKSMCHNSASYPNHRRYTTSRHPKLTRALSHRLIMYTNHPRNATNLPLKSTDISHPPKSTTVNHLLSEYNSAIPPDSGGTRTIFHPWQRMLCGPIEPVDSAPMADANYQTVPDRASSFPDRTAVWV